jgi:hypothetical protein
MSEFFDFSRLSEEERELCLVRLSSSTTNRDLLEILSRSPNQNVRYAMANNRFAPAAVLKTLSIVPEWHVRYYVASNPSTPSSALIRLCSDADPTVRVMAKRNLSGQLGHEV